MSSIIGMLLAVSTILNGILIWYVYKIISKLLYTADNLGDLYIVFGAVSYTHLTLPTKRIV